MSLINRNFQFGEFRLDRDERQLSHSGTPVSLPPKALKLLFILVENSGRIVEKNDLMEQIWPDTFVEDGNLAYTVKRLRKALGDDTGNPTYIETVPRRGYRFIAKVSELERPSGYQTEDQRPLIASNREIERETRIGNRSSQLVWLTMLILLGAGAVGSWYSTNAIYGASVLTRQFEAKRLSTDGTTVYAALSPDGQTVAYTLGVATGKQSLRLRQLSKGNDVEILPASAELYFGIEFAPDSNFLYFVRRPSGAKERGTIYRVPVVGGVPEIIARETEGWFSLSRDGLLISFVRCSGEPIENCSLWLADASTGKNERKLISRPSPLRIGDNAISPDGRSIAFVAGHSMNQAREVQLFEIEIESGKEQAIDGTDFFSVKAISWLPDGTGLLMTAADNSAAILRIWHTDLRSGNTVALTADPQNFSGLSIDRKGELIVATQVRQEYELLSLSLDSPALTRLPSGAYSAQFHHDGGIIISSLLSGSMDIWRIDSEGGSPRQLTNDPKVDQSPVISIANGRTYFSSNRSGEVHVWRMNSDGSDQTQVTKANGGWPLFISNDGQWVFYKNGKDRTLWRVRDDGSEEQQHLNRANENLAFSPDGRSIAIVESVDGKNMLKTLALADGTDLGSYELPDDQEWVEQLAWLPDGSAVAYVAVTKSGERSLLLQPLEGSAPVRVTELEDSAILSIAFEPNGRRCLVTRGTWKHDAVLISGLSR